MTYGFRVKLNWDRIEPALVESFRSLPVANVSDSMSRICALGTGMRPMHRSGNLAGPALTVRTRPGDNLMLHKAIDMAQPGDVIVVDAAADMANSLMGELMLAHAIRRGVAGFVLNGAIRDAEAFLERNVPIFAVGVTHRGPYRTGPGRNRPADRDQRHCHRTRRPHPGRFRWRRVCPKGRCAGHPERHHQET